jgi:hypothetical protein
MTLSHYELFWRGIVMKSLFKMFPDAKMIALAGLYGGPSKFEEYKLGKYLLITPRNSELDNVYLPRMTKDLIEPTSYVLSLADDFSFRSSPRMVNDKKDAELSITIGHLALSIYYRYPFKLGPIYAVDSLGGAGCLVLSRPDIPGVNKEIVGELLWPQLSPFSGITTPKLVFDEGLNNFFLRIAESYSEVRDSRWVLAALKYVSGMSQLYAYEAILDFAVAMESLFNRGEQIGFTLRLYTALLVGKTYGERSKIMRDVKDFYSLRSKLVHGSMLKFNEGQLTLLKTIGEYLGRSLTLTCGKSLDKDVYPELDFMSLVGSPMHSAEKTNMVITEEQILEVALKELNIKELDSYRFYLSEPDSEGERELILELIVNGKAHEPLEAQWFLWNTSGLKGINHYSYQLSQNEDGEYIYLVSIV